MLASILYKNLLGIGTLGVTSTKAGYNALNLLDPRTFTFWMADSAGINYISVEYSPLQIVDSFALINHNLGDAQAQVSLEYWMDQDSVWIPMVNEFSVSDNNVICGRAAAGIRSTKYRIKIVTASIAPKIAAAIIGSRIDFPYPPDAPYIPVSESAVYKTEQSKTGHILGNDVRYKPFTVSAKFTDLPGSFSSILSAFWKDHASEGKPFIYTYNNNAFYVRCVSNYNFELATSRADIVDSFLLSMEGTVR